MTDLQKIAAKKLTAKQLKEALSIKLFGKAPKNKSVLKGAGRGALDGAAGGALMGAQSGAAFGAGYGTIEAGLPGAYRGMVQGAGLGAGAGGLLGGGMGALAGASKTKRLNKEMLAKFLEGKSKAKRRILQNAAISAGATGAGVGLFALLSKGKRQ